MIVRGKQVRCRSEGAAVKVSKSASTLSLQQRIAKVGEHYYGLVGRESRWDGWNSIRLPEIQNLGLHPKLYLSGEGRSNLSCHFIKNRILHTQLYQGKFHFDRVIRPPNWVLKQIDSHLRHLLRDSHHQGDSG